jgi:NitT/TauT family transport system substrate-binding protein
MIVARSIAIVLGLTCLGAQAEAQNLKAWRHGVIEPKGDAGFMLMVGQRDFGARHGLKIEIVPLKNGATAHKALLAGELDSHRIKPRRDNPGRRSWRGHQDSWM